jgi:hypothetical protein
MRCLRIAKAKTNTEDAEDDEEDDLKEVPVSAICHLEQNKLASAEGIHSLRQLISLQLIFCGEFGRTARVTVATNAQRNERHIVFIEKEWLISSIKKRTPPIGAPNATVTPAALDAVRISRILPVHHRSA